MEKEWTIYLRTNLDNGLQYVGQTSDFGRRQKEWHSDAPYANQFINSDRFTCNWTVDILATTDTQEKAWELEKRLITQLKTRYPNGYNVDSGGEFGNKGEETRFFRNSNPSPPSKEENEETDKNFSIVQYGKDGTFIKKWKNSAEAEKELGISHTNILSCCKGRLFTAGGYKWKRC